MFVDHIRIVAKAGNGGDGSASFFRAKGLPKGGPDGGDGGRGGNVVLKVDPHTDNLKTFFYRSHYKAEHGQNGAKNQKTGRSGKDLVLKVPQGTVVYLGGRPEKKPELAEGEWDEDLLYASEGKPLPGYESGDAEPLAGTRSGWLQWAVHP